MIVKALQLGVEAADTEVSEETGVPIAVRRADALVEMAESYSCAGRQGLWQRGSLPGDGACYRGNIEKYGGRASEHRTRPCYRGNIAVRYQ